jgi:dihydrofolate reductase
MLEGKLPWHIPEDFKYFKEKTIGHPIIMGRKTFETFPKLLPGRLHIVISRGDKISDNSNLIFVKSLEEALAVAKQIEQEKIFIIGGGQIYEMALPFADRLYLTFVEGNFNAEVFFPDFNSTDFSKIVSSRKSHDENYEYEFVVLEKDKLK